MEPLFQPGKIIIPTAYFGPLTYYKNILNASEVYLELYETYPKQTLRNRCAIAGPNGLLNLTVPVQKKGNIIIKDIKISYDERWQKLHWKTLATSYNNSPFFMYYDYELLPFFEKRFDYLIDLNEATNEKIMKLIGLKKSIIPTQEFKKEYSDAVDLREFSEVNNKAVKPYPQVFDEKFGFQDNLSILDLLFNKGPDALEHLRI